ncbi:putative N-acetyltransferase [Cladophialophora carrionii]|uniref:N-alpha-acetyltransferase 40 n=1 Tax=Cladophialophora carrionii TaxID=86049 RepID=A0A1C1CC39_9EURO|nr:putative N-acetyltransferase [Cladophialophora carrionii]
MSASKRAKRGTTWLSRKKSQDRADTEGKTVETVNALSCQEFFRKYDPHEARLKLLTSDPKLDSVGVDDAASLSESWREICLRLIEHTSAHDYENSDFGWSVSKKRKEMKLPDMKYITLFGQSTLAGFMSFMVTYEDGCEVLYIYEIHFFPQWQGKGLGKQLMDLAEQIARNIGLAKVMLTVFRANKRAVGWYTKLGYQEDDFSPGPRKLRNGTVKEPSYIILSKQLKR